MAPLRTVRNVALATLTLGACTAVAPALAAQRNAHRGAVCASYHAGAGALPGSCSKHTTTSYANHTCANTRLRPSPTNTALIRAATLCLINRERLAHGERALRPNRRLRRAAQAHSVSMAFGDYFEHDGPSGQTPLARLRDAGYISSSRVSATKSARTSPGERSTWRHPTRSSPHGWPRRDTARTSSTPATAKPASASHRTRPPRSRTDNPARSTRRTSASSSPAEPAARGAQRERRYGDATAGASHAFALAPCSQPNVRGSAIVSGSSRIQRSCSAASVSISSSTPAHCRGSSGSATST